MKSNAGAIAASEQAARGPRVAVAAVSVLVLILSLVGVGSIMEALPNAPTQGQPDLQQMRETIAGYRPIAGSCAICGTVDSIRTVHVAEEPTGLDAATGGLTGVVVGGAPGSGHGSSVTTILGAAGRTFAGSEIEKNAKNQYAYRVTIRMNDGSFRTVSLPSAPAFTVGDKVRVVEGKLVRA